MLRPRSGSQVAVSSPSPGTRASAEPDDRVSAESRLARLAPWLLFVLTAGVHLLLALPMRAPIVHEDEYAYLYAAHYLALGGPPLHAAGYPAAGISPGYSLVLVPLWWISKDAYTVYRGALVVNALLAGATVVLLYVLAGRLAPRLSTGARVVSAAVVGVYPSFLLFSNLALSENLLIPAFLLVCVVALRAFSARRPLDWGMLGVLGGGLYLVHPRGLAAVIALVVVAAWVLWPWRANWQPLAALGVGLVASLAGSQALINHVAQGTTASLGEFHLSRAGDYLLIFYGMAGGLLYLLIGTAGLFALGIWAAARRTGAALRGTDGDDPAVPTVLFMILCLVGVWLLGSLVLAEDVRIDLFVHGRYDDGVLAPILLLGVLLASRLTNATMTRPLLRMAVAASAVIVVCALIVGIARRGETHAPIVRIESIAIDSFLRASHLSLNVVLLAVAGIVTTVVSLVAWRRAFLAGAIVVAILFVPSVATAYASLRHMTAGRASERVVPDTLVELHQHFGANETCVGYDLATDSPFLFFNDRLFDPTDRFAPFDSRLHQRPCSDLVVSGRPDLSSVYPGARLVAVEGNRAGQDLWVLPGALQDRLVREGWSFPQPSSRSPSA